MKVLANAGISVGGLVSTCVIAGLMAAMTGLYLATREKVEELSMGTFYSQFSNGCCSGGAPLSEGCGLGGTIAGVAIVSMLNNVLI